MTDRNPEMHKVCYNCGGNFTCQDKRKKFCSPKCTFEGDRKRALAYYYSKREPSKMETRECLYCKEDFDTDLFHKVYCCSEHRTAAEIKRKMTPEFRAKHRENYKRDKLKEKEAKKTGWTAKERNKYGSKYWFDVIKPGLQREKEAEALLGASNKIPPIQLQRLTAGQIDRCWGRIV